MIEIWQRWLNVVKWSHCIHSVWHKTAYHYIDHITETSIILRKSFRKRKCIMQGNIAQIILQLIFYMVKQVYIYWWLGDNGLRYWLIVWNFDLKKKKKSRNITIKCHLRIQYWPLCQDDKVLDICFSWEMISIPGYTSGKFCQKWISFPIRKKISEKAICYSDWAVATFQLFV